jgi:hypothetical protein
MDFTVEYPRPNALHCWILKQRSKKYGSTVGRARACRLLVLIFAVSEAVANTEPADVVTASDQEWQSLSMVTGFHSFSERENNFQVRVLEANGQATVALNPITLFLIVTNDSSAGDLQQHIWRLPIRVAHVKSVRGDNSEVHIVAMLDPVPDANVKAQQVNIIIRYEVSKGVLGDTIRVRQNTAEAE